MRTKKSQRSALAVAALAAASLALAACAPTDASGGGSAGGETSTCLLYASDAAADAGRVALGGRRISG